MCFIKEDHGTHRVEALEVLVLDTWWCLFLLWSLMISRTLFRRAIEWYIFECTLVPMYRGSPWLVLPKQILRCCATVEERHLVCVLPPPCLLPRRRILSFVMYSSDTNSVACVLHQAFISSWLDIHKVAFIHSEASFCSKPCDHAY